MAGHNSKIEGGLLLWIKSTTESVHCTQGAKDKNLFFPLTKITLVILGRIHVVCLDRQGNQGPWPFSNFSNLSLSSFDGMHAGSGSGKSIRGVFATLWKLDLSELPLPGINPILSSNLSEVFKYFSFYFFAKLEDMIKHGKHCFLSNKCLQLGPLTVRH